MGEGGQPQQTQQPKQVIMGQPQPQQQNSPCQDLTALKSSPSYEQMVTDHINETQRMQESLIIEKRRAIAEKRYGRP
jgi:hypothetical protein